ncbi:MAG TPA: DUF4864 domain-containing protein [Candidatus Nanopelagicus sp.]|nr:DUF4864 domain-containing protein [Candidatus Nanopelagicus sp.]
MRILTLIATLLLISGCASGDQEETASIGPCNSDQKVVVSDHISSQIDAIEKLDFKKAYTYAAQSFQDSVSLAQFESVVTRQYQMLITNNGYSFTDCVAEEGYYIQSVRVKTNSGEIDLTYRLTLIDKRLGVVAVTVKPSSLDLNT